MGLSLGKILVLAVLVAVVWYGFKYRARIEAVRAVLQREAEARRARARQGEPRQTLAAEDLVKCDRCGSYVAAHSASACGRADCPWGR
jgi:ribosomal protein L32